MGPKPSQPQTAELFRPRLDELINMRHPLVKLAAQIGRYAQAKQLSGQKRGITRTLKAMIKRRSAIEPAIGHMKMDGRLARNPLKGALGDALHAVMCGAGHDLRLILAALRLFCARFGLPMQAVIAALIAAHGDRRPVCC
ncbi:hypothetical protein AVHM3334_04230 [Acidovorax sp. SUPP3334]|nr:hypothetical protein AVHM3334_04230 [Acidovorax sp. SUPP3334]